MLDHQVHFLLFALPFTAICHHSNPFCSFCLEAVTHTHTHTSACVYLWFMLPMGHTFHTYRHAHKHPWLLHSPHWTEVACCFSSWNCLFMAIQASQKRNSVLINICLITKISEWLVSVICPWPEDEEHGPGGAERRPQVASGCDLAGSRRQQKQLCGVQQR